MDIVDVWNLPNIDNHLKSSEFMGAVVNLLTDLVDDSEGGVNSNVQLDTSHMKDGFTAAIEVATHLGHPEVALVLSAVIVSLAVFKWLYDAYRRTPATLRCMMAYIVDLTVVMHRLFERSRPSNSAALSSAIVDQELQNFSQSQEKTDIHDAVQSFVRTMDPLGALKKDVVFDKVVSLITSYVASPTLDVRGDASTN